MMLLISLIVAAVLWQLARGASVGFDVAVVLVLGWLAYRRHHNV